MLVLLIAMVSSMPLLAQDVGSEERYQAWKDRIAEYETSLTGSWNLLSDTTIDYYRDDDGQVVPRDISFVGGYTMLLFREDGTGSRTTNGVSQGFTWSVDLRVGASLSETEYICHLTTRTGRFGTQQSYVVTWPYLDLIILHELHEDEDRLVVRTTRYRRASE